MKKPWDEMTLEERLRLVDLTRLRAEEGQPTLVTLADVAPERIDWLWPGYLARGKLHVFDGDPGLGKSTATTDIAARVTTGKPWPDGQPGCVPSGVVLLSAEDGLGDTVRPRLDAAGADLQRVVALKGIKTFDEDTEQMYDRILSLPADINGIESAIESVDGALVVVDPLMAYLGRLIDSHRDQDVRRALAPLSQMADRTGAAVVLVRHLTKGGGSNALYRGGGSIGITGAARLVFMFGRDPQDESRVVMARTKGNIAAEPPALAYRLVESLEHGCAHVEWHDGPVAYSATELVAASQESTEERSDRNEAAVWLRGYLVDNGGEAAATDIFKAGDKAGFARHTLQRCRKRAGITAQKTGFSAGWVWTLATEDDTKATKNTGNGSLSPSSSSVSSSTPARGSDDCPCGRQRHSAGDWDACATCGQTYHRYGPNRLRDCPHCTSSEVAV